MEVQYRLPGSQGSDSIPFAAAIVLSVTFSITAVIRLGGYFLPRSDQPLQLIVSITSLVASGLLFGFVLSRNDSHWCQTVYICSLFVNIGIVGTYEVEACSQIIATVFPRLQQVLLALGILDIFMNIGLCVWFGNNNKDLRSILVVLLCSSCTSYFFISFLYLKLLSRGRKPHPHLLGSSISCILISVLIIILLCVGGANKLPGDLISSTWITLAIVGVSTLRIPYRRWWKSEKLFGCEEIAEEEPGIYLSSLRQDSLFNRMKVSCYRAVCRWERMPV